MLKCSPTSPTVALLAPPNAAEQGPGRPLQGLAGQPKEDVGGDAPGEEGNKGNPTLADVVQAVDVHGVALGGLVLGLALVRVDLVWDDLVLVNFLSESDLAEKRKIKFDLIERGREI